jgi:predicted nucleotidyltransferase
MDLSQAEKSLDQFLHNLPKSIRVEEVIIFGSYLEGNATEDSDIDVYVVSEDFENQDEDQRLRTLYKAARFIEPEVHPWGVTNEELKKASRLTTLGYACESGIRFLDRRR